jgi:hypothetical protein
MDHDIIPSYDHRVSARCWAFGCKDQLFFLYLIGTTDMILLGCFWNNTIAHHERLDLHPREHSCRP